MTTEGPRKPGGAFHLEGARGIQLSGIHIKNARTGISIGPGSSAWAENVTFENVQMPWDIARGTHVGITGSRISKDPKIRKAGGKSQVGWRKPHGPPLPAFCPRCKSIFPSRNYNTGSDYFYSRDNEETCPVCEYEHAKLSDGLFNLSKEVVHVVSAPDFTHAMLAAVGDLSKSVYSGSISPKDAAIQFSKISPKLGRLFKAALKISTTAAVFLTLFMSYAKYQLTKEQVEISRRQLELQEESSFFVEEFTERLLEILEDIEVRSDIPKGEDSDEQHKKGMAKASKRKTPYEGPPSEILPEHYPKEQKDSPGDHHEEGPKSATSTRDRPKPHS